MPQNLCFPGGYFAVIGRCAGLILAWLTLSALPSSATITVVSYWRLGESDPGAAPGVTVTNTIDSTGYATLQFQGNARYASDVAATAASHAGSSLSVYFTNGAYATCAIVSTNTDNFGIECWVKPTTSGSGEVIAYNGGTGGLGDGGWGLLISATNTYQALYGGVTLFGTNTATPNVWTHLALVRDGGNATLYVDGVPSATSSAMPGPPGGNFGLAAPPQSPTNQFLTGLIDEVRVFTFAPGQFSTNDLLIYQTPSVTPPVLTGITLLSNGQLQFGFTNNQNASFAVLASTNLALPLADWSVVGTPVDSGGGNWVFTAPTVSAAMFFVVRGIAASTNPTAPTATTSAASGLTGTTATLNGSANPGGDTATGWFRYSTTSPGPANDTSGMRVPASGGSALGSGTSAVAYSQVITGLTPGTTYYYWPIASNPEGIAFGAVVSFLTPLPPTVTTLSASSVGNTSATLNASGTPFGASTTGWFRYSTNNPGSANDISGTRVPASGGTALGLGYSGVLFSQAISGLSPGTTYYFWAMTTSSEGTAFGSVQNFTTN